MIAFLKWLLFGTPASPSPAPIVTDPPVATARTMHDVLNDLEAAGKDLTSAIENSKAVQSAIDEKKKLVASLEAEYVRLKGGVEKVFADLKALV